MPDDLTQKYRDIPIVSFSLDLSILRLDNRTARTEKFFPVGGTPGLGDPLSVPVKIHSHASLSPEPISEVVSSLKSGVASNLPLGHPLNSSLP
jgi:hypothetical protein